jgi:hypothetical protein
MAHTDGFLRQFNFGAGEVHTVLNSNPVWGVTSSLGHPDLMATCGDDGSLTAIVNGRYIHAGMGSRRKAATVTPASLEFDEPTSTIVVRRNGVAVPTRLIHRKFIKAKTLKAAMLQGGVLTAAGVAIQKEQKKQKQRAAAASKTKPPAKDQDQEDEAPCLRTKDQEDEAPCLAKDQDQEDEAPCLAAREVGLRRVALGSSLSTWRWLAFGGTAGLLHLTRISDQEDGPQV